MDVRSDPLQEALLGVVLERTEATTAELERVTRARCLDDGSFERVDAALRAQGWVLGVLMAAGGNDALLARRERHGLAALVSVVDEGLRRDGRALARADRPVPELGTAGWELPWALGALLWSAGNALPAGGELAWELAPAPGGGAELVLQSASAPPPWLAPALAERVPALEVELGAGAWRARAPAGWLTFEQEAAP